MISIVPFRSSLLLTACVVCWIPAHAEPFRRTLVALYDSSEGVREDNNAIHRKAELILNHLGMKVIYHDIQKGLPSQAQMAEARGVITWFNDNVMDNPTAYCLWVASQVASDHRFVILENFGAGQDPDGKPTGGDALNRAFGALGLHYRGGLFKNPLRIRVKKSVAARVEFERRLEGDPLVYEQWTSVNPANRVLLTIERTDRPSSESDVVVLSPHGGFVAPGYLLYANPDTFQTFWRIDPFYFFEEAFGLEGSPRLDVTTLLGNRLLYIHIDGDGFASTSQVQDETLRYGLSRTCGEVIRDYILKRYPFPTTVSVIQAELDPDYLGSPKLEQVARSLFQLPHTEAASHTFTHPLDWERKLVSFVIDGYSSQIGKEVSAITRESQYPHAARVLVDDASFWQKEITQSIRYINKRLLPVSKRVRMLLWSGNCEPPEEAIRLATELGVSNMNRGDGELDARRPSYTSLAPFTRARGQALQFQTSMANDNIYISQVVNGYSAYQNVIQTFDQSENPTHLQNPTPRRRRGSPQAARRILPLNIYYHFFSAQRVASLAALRAVYENVMARPNVAPIYTSEYVAMVQGFLNARLSRLSDGSWKVEKTGACRTVRFDREPRSPDLRRSKGVIGWSRWRDHLYIYLDGTGQAILRLMENPAPRPHLEQSNAMVYRWKAAADKISFDARVFGRARVELAGLPPESEWELVVSPSPLAAAAARGEGDGAGRLTVSLNGQGVFHIHLNCIRSATL